jgi:hypothetical protein
VEVKETPFHEKRVARRIIIDSILFPFLASREEDHACFQYLILDISLHGLKIAIPKWLVSREVLKEEELINLHLPFQLDKESFDQGKIVWARWDDEMQAQVCGVQVQKKPCAHYPIFVSFETKKISIDLGDFFSSERLLLLKLLKDAFLLKRGVLIYLNHLIPYFSRITEYPSKDYALLKEFFLDDVRNKVEKNQKKLEQLYEESREERSYQTQLAQHLDLEELRMLVESEIYMEVLKSAFETDSVMPYLRAIKKLEKKLYYNYNTIVMLYIRSL